MIINYPLLYRTGVIADWYLRKPDQYNLYNMLRKYKKVVAKCHRRFGKGTTVLVYVFERLHTENIIVRYGAPTIKQAKDILSILVDHIYEKCPESRPSWSSKDGCLYWKDTGAKMYIFGCKDAEEADKARGTEAHIIICDEFAFWKYRPKYMLDSVLSPQLDTTHGQLIITSTPPDDLTHPYLEEVMVAQKGGYLFEHNINDSLRLWMGNSLHERIIERCKGIESDAYRREYLCELIPDKTKLVIPEAQNEETWVMDLFDYKHPEHRQWYMFMDLGLKDYTAVIWGYLDFLKNRFIVMKELVCNYKSTKEITDICKTIEMQFKIENIIRYADNEQQQLFDMARDYNYQVTAIQKRSKQPDQSFKESVINGLRIAIQDGKVKVDKKITPHLYSQLKFGIWNERRNDFERSDGLGHLDATMALAYGVDNVIWTKNPYPKEKVDTFNNYVPVVNMFTPISGSISDLASAFLNNK